MSARVKPPFRADHVGSLLRSPEVHKARDDFQKGAIPPAKLREIEDKAIRDAIKMQEDVGLKAVTDGEIRRAESDYAAAQENLQRVRALAAAELRKAASDVASSAEGPDRHATEDSMGEACNGPPHPT